MTALAMTPDEMRARERRTRWLVAAHVLLALAFVAGFVIAQIHRG